MTTHKQPDTFLQSLQHVDIQRSRTSEGGAFKDAEQRPPPLSCFSSVHNPTHKINDKQIAALIFFTQTSVMNDDAVVPSANEMSHHIFQDWLILYFQSEKVPCAQAVNRF